MAMMSLGPADLGGTRPSAKAAAQEHSQESKNMTLAPEFVTLADQFRVRRLAAGEHRGAQRVGH